jgi:N-succinyldiaminopimelate aminotransferase
MKPLDATLASQGTTIFEAMSALAREHAAINLGQGFPDAPGPLEERQAAAEHVVNGNNQYPPMWGMPALRQAVATHTERFTGLAYDPATEVLVTSGATEALLDCFLALVTPGDEVVLFEPAYDTYAPVIRRLGGIVRTVQLEPPSWDGLAFPLAYVCGPGTKLIVLNTPMNPAGKVFTRNELEIIAALATAHDAYVVCDEVYEHLVFGTARHVSIASVPGMRERTLRIGSAGKTFSMTGWKVGYVTGPAELVRVVAKAHQLATFTTPPHLQHAVALGLGRDEAFFRSLGAPLERSRDRLAAGLAALGLPTLRSDGTYFLVADVSSWLAEGEDDIAFCRRLVLEAGVALIPMSAFYTGGAGAPRHLVRFCFCKLDATIDEALRRLRLWVDALMR